MRIQWQKFLAVGALSALGALGACQIEVVDGPPGAGGTGGTGGMAGTAGTGGAKGDAAQPETGTPDATSGDAPSADGASGDVGSDAASADRTTDGPAPDVAIPSDASPDGGDASAPDVTTGDTVTTDVADAATDAAGGCFAEDQADGGVVTRCANLSYWGVVCRDDAGTDGPPAGATLCRTLDTDLKASALLELFDCLKVLPGGDGGMDACGSAHEQGAADCSRSIFNRSMCPVADGMVDGGLYGCAQIAASCGPDSGDGGIPAALCQSWLGPFNAAARQGIIECYLDPDPTGATSCRDKFENYCVFQ